MAPEFQDPPAAQNYPPFIVEAKPAEGSIVVDKTFKIVVRDPNPADNFYVRWEADYPPFSTANTRPLNDPSEMVPHPTGAALAVELPKSVDCSSNALAVNLPQHQITVIVADRPFLADPKDPGNLGKVTPPGFAVTATWTLNLECVPP